MYRMTPKAATDFGGLRLRGTWPSRLFARDPPHGRRGRKGEPGVLASVGEGGQPRRFVLHLAGEGGGDPGAGGPRAAPAEGHAAHERERGGQRGGVVRPARELAE